MPETLLPALLTATSTTAACVFLARTLTAAVAAVRAPLVRRRQAAARTREAGWIAEGAQGWLRSPAVLGGSGAPGAGFAGLTFAVLGLASDARDVRHTAVGAYRLVPIAPCPTLDGCARIVGAERPAAGGLLVVGTCGVPAGGVAVLVLGPLVQVTLPTVPWGWVRALTTPATDPLLPVPTSAAPAVPMPVAEVVAAARPLHARPQRERRMPSWRSPKHTTRRRDRA